MRRGCGCAVLGLLALVTAPWWVPVAVLAVFGVLELAARLLGGA